MPLLQYDANDAVDRPSLISTFSGQDPAGFTGPLASTVSEAGWRLPTHAGVRGEEKDWFGSEWKPHLNEAKAALVCFTAKYKERFTHPLKLEADALLERKRRDGSSFPIYVIHHSDDINSVHRWLTTGETDKNFEGWKAFVERHM